MANFVGAGSSPFSSPQSAAWNPTKAIEDGAKGGAVPAYANPPAHAAVVIGLLVLLALLVAYHRGKLPYFRGRASAAAGA